MGDGDPGEPSLTLSPVTYLYEHRAELDVAVQATTASARDAAFDALLGAVATAIAGDRTLGGLADRIEALAPVSAQVAADGAAPIKAATAPVILIYATTDPPA